MCGKQRNFCRVIFTIQSSTAIIWLYGILIVYLWRLNNKIINKKVKNMKKNFMMLCLLAAAMQSCGDKQKSAETTEAEAPAQEQAEAKAEEGVTAGAQAPDFNYKDISGKEVSLKTFQGKYVVLDFWGIWCKWCVKGIPDMKKYYDMYKEKMEIVSIDNGDEMDKLLPFIQENDMNWTHIMNDAKGNTDLCKLYQVQGFPTKVLIDPQGKIVEVFVGEVPEFYQKLDELLK